jgi:hypothetical protein
MSLNERGRETSTTGFGSDEGRKVMWFPNRRKIIRLPKSEMNPTPHPCFFIMFSSSTSAPTVMTR